MQRRLKYCGHILTAKGIIPDPAKVEAITQTPRPRSKTEVRRLLGMINYLGKFLPQLSDVSELLGNLTKEQNKFIWSQVHEDFFEEVDRDDIKTAITPILRFGGRSPNWD